MGANANRFFKLRHVVQATTSVGGVLQHVITNDPTLFEDWENVKALFDSYKICALKVKFIPSRPNDSSDHSGATGVTYNPCYVVGDPDDVNAMTSVDQAIQYENMKVKNLFRPWTYYMKIPKRTQVSTATTIIGNGYIDCAMETPNASIKVFSDGLTADLPYGQFIVTGYFTAKNRV